MSQPDEATISNPKDSGSDDSDVPTAEGPKCPRERRRSAKKKYRFIQSKSLVKTRRLRGGGDNPPPADEVPPAEGEDGESPVGGSLSASTSKSVLKKDREPLKSTGDPRVDELLECTLNNLEEAAKALSSLGENIEHELKLFLVELMDRTRKWMSGVEGKLEWARRDIMDIHKEMESKVRDIDTLRRDSDTLTMKLKGAEQARGLAQRSLAEGLKGDGGKALSATRSVQLGPMLEQCMKSRSETNRLKNPDGPVDDLAALREEQENLAACCVELENELLELRKENQRIVKERAEYENAIQRALLKGVSSLNVEALKVLRCTPIPTCCPPCPSSEIEPVKNGGPMSGSKPSSPMANINGNGNGRMTSAKRPCPASEKKPRKSKDNNMLLLLHQKDAENFGIQTGGGCDQGAAAKKANICSGGNCGKGGGRNSNGCN